MLIILAILGLGVGITKTCHSATKLKKFLSGSLCVIFEVILSIILYLCYFTPVRNEKINTIDIKNRSIYLSDTEIRFSNTEAFPYSAKDTYSGYTTAIEIAEDNAHIDTYSEKWAVLKFVLSFKAKQDIIVIYYNNNNNISH